MPAFKSTALIGWFILSQSAAAWAGTVSVEPDKSHATIVVTAGNATVDEILETLAERTAFDLERIGDVELPRTITHTYTGTPRQIVDRLLKNENYAVLTSSEAGSIQRVVVYARPSVTAAAWSQPAAPMPLAQPLPQPQPVQAVAPRPVRNTVPDVPPPKATPPATRRTLASTTSLTTRSRQ